MELDNVVVNGDVLDVMKHVPNETFHLTLTSPPYYNARDYAQYQSYEAYLAFLEEVFRETHRATKEGRFLAVNTSPVIEPRASRQSQSRRFGIPFDLHVRLTGMGWDFMEDIVWVKPEASVKNRIGRFTHDRNPLAWKPNVVTEYVMVYRKHTDRLIDWNIGCYTDDVKAKSKVTDGYDTSNVWHIVPKSHRIHPAVFPMELCEKIIRYYSYHGDLVFDPFGGSGTTGMAASMLGRKFFMIERDKGYYGYMKRMMDGRFAKISGSGCVEGDDFELA